MWILQRGITSERQYKSSMAAAVVEPSTMSNSCARTRVETGGPRRAGDRGGGISNLVVHLVVHDHLPVAELLLLLQREPHGLGLGLGLLLRLGLRGLGVRLRLGLGLGRGRGLRVGLGLGLGGVPALGRFAPLGRRRGLTLGRRRRLALGAAGLDDDDLVAAARAARVLQRRVDLGVAARLDAVHEGHLPARLAARLVREAAGVHLRDLAGLREGDARFRVGLGELDAHEGQRPAGAARFLPLVLAEGLVFTRRRLVDARAGAHALGRSAASLDRLLALAAIGLLPKSRSSASTFFLGYFSSS
jgi:hypothetical protein